MPNLNSNTYIPQDPEWRAGSQRTGPAPFQGATNGNGGAATRPTVDPNPFGSDAPAPTDPAQHAMIERDKGIWESRLRNEAAAAGVGYDPSDLEGVLRQLRYAENAGVDPERFVSQAVERYSQRASNVPGQGRLELPPVQNGGWGDGGPVSRAAQAYNRPGAAGPLPQQSGLGGLLEMLRGQLGRREQGRAEMRDVLMSQLGQAQRPISATDPGIAPILDAERLALQRSAERQRSQMAARLASEGLLDSGAFDTGLSGIEQARGEAEAGFTGQVLHRELDARRQQLGQLLNLAVQSGDAEAARNIQTQLAAIQSQMADAYRYDQLGANVGMFGAGLNQQALLSLLNAGLLGG